MSWTGQTCKKYWILIPIRQLKIFPTASRSALGVHSNESRIFLGAKPYNLNVFSCIFRCAGLAKLLIETSIGLSKWVLHPNLCRISLQERIYMQVNPNCRAEIRKLFKSRYFGLKSLIVALHLTSQSNKKMNSKSFAIILVFNNMSLPYSPLTSESFRDPKWVSHPF